MPGFHGVAEMIEWTRGIQQENHKVHIPELVAHRGYALHYPENTLIGIEAAIRADRKSVV